MGSDARHHAVCGSTVGLLLFAVATPSAAQSQRSRPCPKAGPDVTLVWYDVFGVFRHDIAGSSREVQEVFCRVGIEVAWRASEPGGSFGGGEDREVAVTVLHRYRREREGAPVMGVVSAALTPGLPRPVYIYLEGVAAALGIRGVGDAGLPKRLLARAVGRVVAHEVVHSLAPWEGHTEQGLMRSSLGRDALLGELPSVGELHVGAVRVALDDGGLPAWKRLGAKPPPIEVLTAPLAAAELPF